VDRFSRRRLGLDGVEEANELRVPLAHIEGGNGVVVPWRL
jgi:hypothetical protein